MSGLPRRVPDEKWREEKRDEGVMGREGEKRGIICSAEIFPAAAVMEHTHTRCCKSEAFPDSASPPLI